MQQEPKTGCTGGFGWPRRICTGLASIVLAGVASLANADVTVCTGPGEVASLRVGFRASFENAITVSDNNGRRLIGFNSFFGRGAGGEWTLGDGTWQTPQHPERQCFRIAGQHRTGPANPAPSWKPSACRVSGQTIRYEDGGEDGKDRSYNDARVDIFGGHIDSINPPCQGAPGIRVDEMPRQLKRPKPPMLGRAPPADMEVQIPQQSQQQARTPAQVAKKAPAAKKSAKARTPAAARDEVIGGSRPPGPNGSAGSGGEQPRATLSFKLPEFPFPPPDPSARLRIPNGTLTGTIVAPTFGSVATRMEAALASNGYTELSYFAVPGGFALVTQIERINPDATPAAEQRWNVEVEPVSLRSFSLEAYVRALLQKDAGFFRVIVFVFSSEPFTASGKKVPVGEAMKWIDKGANTLPRDVASQPYSEDMVCTALVYEFEIPTHGADALLRKPSSHDGAAHLRASGILRALGE